MISIIIPTFNRAAQLERTLQSLMTLNTSTQLFEIIIVDNGSKDGTEGVVKKYLEAYKTHQISYVYDEEPGLLTGRHRGAKEAKGEILTFIDDDVNVSHTWLDTIIDIMAAQPDTMLLTGPSLPKYETYPPDWLNYFWTIVEGGKICGWLSLLDLGSKAKEIDPNYVWGLNFTIRRSAFIDLGGFHPDLVPKEYRHLQGDGETGLTIKASEKGMKAMYHPGVMLYHEVPAFRMTLEYFEKRAEYQGVCNSFTEIRKVNKLYKTNSIQQELPEKRKKSVGILLEKYLFLKKIKESSGLPAEIAWLNRKIAAKERQGYDFHQENYNNDPVVKQWVLKENFMDYKLPSNA